MSRRKGERTTKMNERDYPHIVEVRQPENGFGNVLYVMLYFHTNLGIDEHRGKSRRLEETRGQFVEYCRWCFDDPQHASSFAATFGGQIVRG
jgi:hypothetical protein